MITSAFDMFTAPGTAVATSAASTALVNGYNNNTIADKLYITVFKQAGTDTIGIKLQTSWDNSTWVDVADFGTCTEDANGCLLKTKVPHGKPVLRKYIRLYYTITGPASGAAGDTVLKGAYLTFGIDEDFTDVVANPAFNPLGNQPTVQ